MKLLLSIVKLEKKKRNETMKNEKMQLSSKLTAIEEENSVRDQQLQTEQTRIKDLQLNIQMLEDHNSILPLISNSKIPFLSFFQIPSNVI